MMGAFSSSEDDVHRAVMNTKTNALDWGGKKSC